MAGQGPLIPSGLYPYTYYLRQHPQLKRAAVSFNPQSTSLVDTHFHQMRFTPSIGALVVLATAALSGVYAADKEAWRTRSIYQ